MKIDTMRESKYLKKEDVGQGKLVTIVELGQVNVAMEDQPPEMKWVIHFNEFPKGMVLNWTNIQLIAKALGTEETDEWKGKKIVIYEDDNVSFGGKLVGGIRCRAARQQTAQTPIAGQNPAAESEDPNPF